MKDPDPKMKNNELSTSDIINGNWVMKRKRKKIPSGSVKLNGNNITESVQTESHTSTSSPLGKLKKESSSDRSFIKEKGNDGNYYECVVCDLGGDLLCCDNCPSTYHIECLDPPLKKIPIGKWKCPSCCLKDNPVSPVDDLDPTSKRAKTKAKTKTTSKKSKSRTKSAKTDKNEKKKSTKGKSPISSQIVDLSDSSFSDVKNDKQSDEEEDNKNMEMEINEDNKEVVLGIESVKKKSTKRKSKIPSNDVQKKPRIDKGKKAADNSQIKRKSVKTAKSKSLSKSEMGSEIRDSKLKDEMVGEEATNSLNEFGEIQKLADFAPDNFQQVDRVLGCRIQIVEKDSVTEANETPSHSLNVEENRTCENTSNVENTEIVNGPTESGLSPCDTQTLTNNPSDENITGLVGQPIGNPETVNEPTEDSLSPSDTQTLTNNPSHENITGLVGQPVDELALTLDDKIDVNIKENCSPEKNEPVAAGSLPSDPKTVSYEFLVKWVGKSHLHNSWVPESLLKVVAKRKLDNYKFKYGRTVINISEERWKIPQKVIAKDGNDQVFVKWTGLPYDECTWESINEPVIAKSSHLIDLFNQFEQQTLEKDSKNYKKIKDNDVVTLTEQPIELKGSLFPHQLEALNWLRKCWSKSKNVILADEMGLGKTISACAFLSSLYFEFEAKLPSLVLVPLSTMPNWMAEFSLWAPNLNVVEYHGPARARSIMREYEWHANEPVSKKKTSGYKFNVLLTTYEMVLADSTHLSKIPWEVLIVDEGHRLKNSGSKLFSLLNTFSFQHRVLLTGTPLQNNLGEMYNLLNFLQPVSFPSLKSFEDKFSDLATAEKVDELKKLVAPHMLRRLKKDAMQNIPPKTERVVPVDLSTIQAEYYRAMLTKNYQVLRNIGKGVPQQSMLNIVMQLRKVCNHPYLIPGTEPESGTIEFLHDMRIKASAKLDLLHNMLKILHKEGHRVLIFSQMTKLLDILEDYLNIEFGPKTFERVDGSVSIADRQMAIARFNQDKSRFVFLLSTRSCGLGINLASADTVIIYDSDFNPHADIQAMNRAHRIGQSKRLLVYRLVVRASVEERILQLAKKKLMLDHLFVNKSGSQKEVEDILKWGTEQLFNDSVKDSGENDVNKSEVNVDLEHKNKKRVGGLGDVYQDKCTDGNTQILWDETAILKLLDRSNIDSVSTDNVEGDMENDMLGSVKSLDWNDEPTEEQGGTESPLTIIDGTHTPNSDKKEDNSVNVTEENEWDRLLRVRWEKYQSEEEAALGRGKRVRKAVQYREAYAAQTAETLNQNGADVEPEPQPEREYTPAGKALKIKYGKLRARQKDRLARMKAFRESLPIEGQDGQNADQEVNPSQPLDPQTSNADPTSKPGKEKESVQSVRLPTVLGLCAPNSKLLESANRNSSRSFIRQAGNQPTGLEFPFNLAPCSGPHNAKARIKFQHSDPDPDTLQHNQKTGLSPFTPEMMSLPKLPFDMTKLPSRDKNVSHPQPDFFPNLTLGRSIHEFPTIPMLPKLRFRTDNQQEMDLGQMQLPTFASLPENHRKVLENIMMRTGPGSGPGSASSNYLKRKLVKDFWSEDELDFLWIGVRRHGLGGWDAMIQDPRLKFSRFRTAEDLAGKWEEEQLKILETPIQKQSKKGTKSGKNPVFPGISDGMMKRALHKNWFTGGGGPFGLFQPHQTEMKLGFDENNTPEKMNPLGFENGHFPQMQIPPWNLENGHFPVNFSGESSSGGPDRFEQNVVPNPFLLNSLGLNGMGLFNSHQIQREGFKMPNFVDIGGENGGDRKGKEAAEGGGGGGGSLENKLPHWLRKAVGGGGDVPQPPPPPPEPELPPTVSAIAESVRLLYRDETPTIPPFIPPALLPSCPEDPRRIFKKKKNRRQSHGLNHQLPPVIPGTSHQPTEEHVASTSGTLGTEADLNVPPPSPPSSPSPPCVDQTAVVPPCSPEKSNPESKMIFQETTGNPSACDPTVEVSSSSSEGTVSDHES